MTDSGSAELRDVYEEHYRPEAADAPLFGRWRALCAEGKADHVAALAGALPAAPRAVVEIGCGEGVLLAALGRRGIGERREGFDISESAVSLARGRAEIERAERFDGETLPAADGAYDLAVLSHVLEHVPDPVPLLRETARVARAVVVEVPLEDNRAASRAHAQRAREELGHLHRFDRAAVRRLVDAAGLRVLGEVADPLPREVHTFFASGVSACGKALAKAAARRALFTVAPRTAERSFTVHYACLCLPRAGVRDGP